MVGICTAILVAVALNLAQSIIVPLVFALFVIALVWPVQGRLQARMPQLLALLVTVLVALVTVVVLALLIAWAFSSVGQWVIGNAARFQLLYAQKLAWLEGQGIGAAGLLAEHFNVRSLVRIAQELTGRLQGMLSFTVVTLVFTLLGLLEVEVVRRQLQAFGTEGAAGLLRAARDTSAKLRTYMLVRTLMSLITGVAVYGFARAMGLELAAEWGVIAFVMNYIPFLGPLIATLFPTVFAILQFESWQVAILVFLTLNAIQFVTGSYIEPRLAGARLAVSPFLVLVAVFFGGFLWGMPGAFIGVPLLIAALTLCEQFPRTRWVADLLSGRDPPAG